jgi:hypothetical protein
MRTMRFRTAVVGATTLLLALAIAVPALASGIEADDETAGTGALTPLEAQRFERWFQAAELEGSLAVADVPLDALREAGEVALAEGVSKEQLRSAVFSDMAREVFAGNAAGGQGEPSPYLEYFTNNPAQLGALGDLLAANEGYVAGPGGTQDQLFATFDGLRESYLASLGLVEIDGRIVDPRNPRLTPYFAALFLGVPAPLPQPDVALNVEVATDVGE